MGLFWGKRKPKEDNGPVVVAIISNPVSSLVFQDILKENGIPFICHNEGAGASMKLLFGVGAAADYILVASENAERAREFYEAYLLTEATDELFDEED